MKFHQLRPGTGFRYQGVTYRKISPLMAVSGPDDTQRLVPRSAQVDVLDDSDQALIHSLPDSLPGTLVETTLIQFAASCMTAATTIGPPLAPDQLAQFERAIAAARTETLARLANRQENIE